VNRELLLDKLATFGSDAVSFQALESGLRWWHDAAPPSGTGASLAFHEVGRSWIAVGTPLVAQDLRSAAAQRFADEARVHHKRAVFFGVEQPDIFADFHRLPIGLQSELRPSLWAATLRRSPKLREQLRRARAKGVLTRIVAASELTAGLPLRNAVEELRDEWLGLRPMEPMVFLVSVEPFHAPERHVYILAEWRGKPVQFLSAVPIGERCGWLMEDMLRSVAAPNGTTELLIDRLMQHVQNDSELVTPGLTPLAGPIPWWLRLARDAAMPLYDFSGLRRFRARLSPPVWRRIWLVWDRGPVIAVLLDVLRAFAGGRLLPFACRSLVRHPNGPPWAVAVPLVFWTLLLAALAATDRAWLLGFSTALLWGWVVFDAVLAALLFRAARRPQPRRLAAMLAATTFDAIFSVRHLAVVGPGTTVASATLRLVATLGPLVGTAGLALALRRALLLRRSRRAAHARS
jgi:phosphatidylglycerol lysyltransferase